MDRRGSCVERSASEGRSMHSCTETRAPAAAAAMPRSHAVYVSVLLTRSVRVR